MKLVTFTEKDGKLQLGAFIHDDPMMHKTAAIDYPTVLKGEIWAILDNDEVCHKQGDVMVQRGTNHSWGVRTDNPCILVAILVNAKPV